MMEKYYEYSKKKDLLLKINRGVSFEDVIEAIETGGLLAKIDHPNIKQYAHQKVYVVEINGYAYWVPCVEKEDGVFLKTIFPSRKATKQYLSGGNNNEKTEI